MNASPPTARDIKKTIVLHGANNKENDLLLLLVLSFLLRLVIAPFFGYLFDLQGYVNWGIAVNQHFFTFYSAASTPGTSVYQLPNYPPLLVYMFGLMVGSYLEIAHLLGVHASLLVSDSRILMTWMKVPAILFDLATTALIYHIACKKLSQTTAFLVSAAYAFSPAVLLDAAVWGQTDGIPVFFSLLSFVCIINRRSILSGIFCGLAIMTKEQAIIVLPLLLWYCARWMGWWKAGLFSLTVFLTACLVCLPYLLPPHPEILVLFHNIQLWSRATHVSNYAFNIWWLLSLGTLQYALAFLSPVMMTIIGWGLFICILLCVLRSIHTDNSPKVLFQGAALLSVAMFVLAPLQMERYLYPALAFLLIAFISTRQHRSWYLIATASTFANMLLFLLIRSIPSVPFLHNISFLLIFVSFLVALGNVWLLIAMVRNIIK